MITRSGAAPSNGSGRVLRIAIAASVLVHLLLVLIATGAYDAFDRVLAHHPARRVAPDETVTLSTAVHFEKRPRAAATHAGRPSTVARPVRQREPVAQPPPERELAKNVPRATPAPRATHTPATALAKSASRHQVALAQHEPITPAHEAPSHAALSAAQLAMIQSDLAASIARDRARENPLSNVAHRVNPASTIRRYAINVAGTGAILHGAQGLCSPLRTWTGDGYVYFYVSCRTQHPDGSVRIEVIPWPLRFRPDQISYGAGGPAPPPGQIPLPPAGWKPPASQFIDPDVLNFLRERGYSV